MARIIRGPGGQPSADDPANFRAPEFKEGSAQELLMPLDTTAQTAPAALQQHIERQIAQRTWGRVHQLRVVVADGRVSVHGYTARYYDKQLAIQAVLETVSSYSASVNVAIEVGPSEPCATRGAGFGEGAWHAELNRPSQH
jgi:hypothetical protein